jgi:adenylate cyclase
MTVEIELKLALPEESQRILARHPLLRAAGRPSRKRLVNLYFDTPALDLHSRGIALRLRKQGHQWLQTVKCAGTVSGGLSERPEWEQPCVDGRFDFGAIDDENVRRVLERALRRGQLARVFETEFERRTWRIQTHPGEALLLMADHGSVKANARIETISEIELELAGGSAASLFDIARTLAADLTLKPEILSKAERGYRLVRDSAPQPVHADPSRISAGATPLEAFRSVALSCLAHLQANETGAMHTSDPEFFHQMRVALRRLRSAMRLFRPVLPPEVYAALTPRLRALTNSLGPARDWDVTIDDVLLPAQRALGADSRLDALVRAAQSQREEARRRARHSLASPEYGRLMLDLVAEVHGVDQAASGERPADLLRFARKRLRKLRQSTGELAGVASTREVPALHALRVGIKRLRYAQEFFAPLHPAKRVKEDVGRLAKLQTKLGFINDLALAGRLLSGLVDSDASLGEGMALVGEWYKPRFEAARRRMAPRIARLAGAAPSRSA